jgi:hypothetical protein
MGHHPWKMGGRRIAAVIRRAIDGPAAGFQCCPAWRSVTPDLPRALPETPEPRGLPLARQSQATADRGPMVEGASQGNAGAGGDVMHTIRGPYVSTDTSSDHGSVADLAGTMQQLVHRHFAAVI